MGCNKCGRRTTRSQLCKLCAREERRKNYKSVYELTRAECPRCNGVTSGEGVVCANCRRDGGDDA